jgi:hypothetical protein
MHNRGQRLSESLPRVYCVEKVARQQFREISEIQPLRDYSIAAALLSRDRQASCPDVNLAEVFNTIGQKQPSERGFADLKCACAVPAVPMISSCRRQQREIFLSLGCSLICWRYVRGFARRISGFSACRRRASAAASGRQPRPARRRWRPRSQPARQHA